MRRAVEGRFTVLRVLIFETDLTFVTFTLGVAFEGVATFRVAVGEVLRVRVLRVFVGVEADDLTGIGIDSDVYYYNIAIKNPLVGVGWSVCELSHILKTFG